jgi:hypothetical protein
MIGYDLHQHLHIVVATRLNKDEMKKAEFD